MAGVAVFAIDGKNVITDNSGSETLSVELPVAGVYIVKVGAETFKVIR